VSGRTTPVIPKRKEEEDEIEADPGGRPVEMEEEEGFDLSWLEIEEMEEDDVQPHFLGDRLLLYSHEAPESTPLRRMMVFQGSVAGHQAVILLDLGANTNFVSKEWALSKSLAQRQLSSPMEVTTATGRTYAATSQVLPAEVVTPQLQNWARNSPCPETHEKRAETGT
jgi:hypothetical protein